MEFRGAKRIKFLRNRPYRRTDVTHLGRPWSTISHALIFYAIPKTEVGKWCATTDPPFKGLECSTVKSVYIKKSSATQILLVLWDDNPFHKSEDVLI